MANKILLETGTNEMELLAVIVDGQYFGMNVPKAHSIQQFDPRKVTGMSRSAESIIGVLSYRKKSIPVIDLAQILGKESSPEDSKDIVVIIEFENGKMAFDYFMELKNEGNNGLQNSVLISDIETPVMDGLTLCKSLKNDPDLQQLHVTMFSSLINRQMIEKCKSVGTDNYVTKPEVNKLIHILDDFFEGNSR